MKKTLMCSLLTIALICCGTVLYAQTQQQGMGQSQAGGPGPGHHMMSPDQRLQHMTRQLDLNDDQQQKIKPMLEQEQQQLQALHQDTSMSRQDRMSKMMQIRQSTNDEINKVLSADQQKKFQEMQNRNMQRMNDMGQGKKQPTPQ